MSRSSFQPLKYLFPVELRLKHRSLVLPCLHYSLEGNSIYSGWMSLSYICFWEYSVSLGCPGPFLCSGKSNSLTLPLKYKQQSEVEMLKQESMKSMQLCNIMHCYEIHQGINNSGFRFQKYLCANYPLCNLSFAISWSFFFAQERNE